MGNNIQSTTNTVVNVTNLAYGSKQNTFNCLLRMAIKNISDKTVVNNESKKKFRGRLFYAIVPN